MRIGCDLDGVVIDFVSVANGYLCDKLRRTPVEVDVWDWHSKYGEDPAVEGAWKSMWRGFNNGGLFYRCKPIPGAINGLKLLEQMGHEITFVTHRALSTITVTSTWLLHHELEWPVIHTKNKWETGCDVYVDDHVETVKALMDHGYPAYLFDQPWNRDAGPLIPRLNGWGAVVAEIYALGAVGASA